LDHSKRRPQAARPLLRGAGALVCGLAAASCGAEGPGAAAGAAEAPSAAVPAVSPAAAFARIEDAWLRQPHVHVAFHVTAEGAFRGELEGELMLAGEEGVFLTARGTFGGEAVELTLNTRAGRMTGGRAGQSFDEPIPTGLREGVAIGFTRMGILHNLARLTAALPPDRTDGTVRSWVEARDLAWLPAQEGGAASGLRFAVWVDGAPAADATLWLAASGAPLWREGTVRFPGGEMRVTERYEVQ